MKRIMPNIVGAFIVASAFCFNSNSNAEDGQNQGRIISHPLQGTNIKTLCKEWALVVIGQSGDLLSELKLSREGDRNSRDFAGYFIYENVRMNLLGRCWGENCGVSRIAFSQGTGEYVNIDAAEAAKKIVAPIAGLLGNVWVRTCYVFSDGHTASHPTDIAASPKGNYAAPLIN